MVRRTNKIRIFIGVRINSNLFRLLSMSDDDKVCLNEKTNVNRNNNKNEKKRKNQT